MFVSKLQRNSAEFSAKLVTEVFTEAIGGLDDWKKQQEEVEKGNKGKWRGISSWNVSGSESVAQSTSPSDVIYVLIQSSESKLLGDGLAGLVTEWEYKR